MSNSKQTFLLTSPLLDKFLILTNLFLCFLGVSFFSFFFIFRLIGFLLCLYRVFC